MRSRSVLSILLVVTLSLACADISTSPDVRRAPTSTALKEPCGFEPYPDCQDEPPPPPPSDTNLPPCVWSTRVDTLDDGTVVELIVCNRPQSLRTRMR